MATRYIRTGAVQYALLFQAESLLSSYANGATIDSWQDLSGNGRNASNTGTARPTFVTGLLNGYPAVRFTTNQFLQFTRFSQLGAYACLVVGKKDSAGVSLVTLGDRDSTRLVYNQMGFNYTDSKYYTNRDNQTVYTQSSSTVNIYSSYGVYGEYWQAGLTTNTYYSPTGSVAGTMSGGTYEPGTQPTVLNNIGSRLSSAGSVYTNANICEIRLLQNPTTAIVNAEIAALKAKYGL
ncbi:hypothetical protein [Xanthocytophaga flava]|uniref:hypothetical protein n=1 Tax=Xanthocytophaga flava TaxID=3048013 RepID=UPI0028D1702A|nr:hypothetical protein [Xanthocytophaga flavus]MDJ1468175.1 hypothetical protein [Xanthocytophaga flavus]